MGRVLVTTEKGRKGMLRTNTMLLLAGLATLVAVGGWGTYARFTPGHKTQPVPIPMSQAVLPASTTPQAGLFLTSETPGTFYQAPTLKTDVQFDGLMTSSAVINPP